MTDISRARHARHSELDTLTLCAMRAHALGVDCALTDPPAAAKHFAEAALCHAEIDKTLARWAANKETT